MENQHRKIAGYRELSHEEIDLMNRIKAKGAEMLQLHAELDKMLVKAFDDKHSASTPDDSPETLELRRFIAAEPYRWAAIGKTDIQTGIMALIRAVAQPAV